MKQNFTAAMNRAKNTFGDFSTAQKMIVVIGAGALLLGGFMVFKWAATPNYAPLYGNLASADASAVIDELDANGIKYKITNNGSTIMVPKDDVYSTRITLSGKGLPSGSDTGYEILDDQSFTTGEFKEQTDFKRAMEGELSNTIEAMDSVNTAVVHLALPEKKVFADEQDPATASILVKTRPGATLNPEQVQAIVHLVASSIDGLDPTKVTVADASGKVLTTPDGASGAATTQMQQVEEFQSRMRDQVQATLDRVLGPGKSTVQVTADLDFDKARTESRTYTSDPDQAPLSEHTQSETYTGANPDGNGTTGVVGPDGQMDSMTDGAGGDSEYNKSSTTRDNAVNSRTEFRETAPGGVQNLHVGIMVDNRAAMNVDTNEISEWVAAATGIDAARGDTVRVTAMPFDTSTQDALNKELEAAAAADAASKRNGMIRDGALILAVLLLVAFAFWRERRRSKERARATSYVVEQLRGEALTAPATSEVAPATALLALEANEPTEAERLQGELIDLVERQPEDVAALLRGWLVDRP